ncbi:MAG TPA: VOC family protein [Rhizobiaceae bacterium]|nr:VOC family protein [Rhizobiaceae bacterium]
MNWSIHHVTLETHDIKVARHFYGEVLGLKNGAPHTIGTGTGDMEINDKVLAVIGDGNRGLHLLTPHPHFARDSGFSINPAMGGHVAINVDDIEAVKKRLDAEGVFYQDAGEHAAPGWSQIYLYDPSGNLIEVNQIR